MELKFKESTGEVFTVNHSGTMCISGEGTRTRNLAVVNLTDSILQQYPYATVKFITEHAVQLFAEYADAHENVSAVAAYDTSILMQIAEYIALARKRSDEFDICKSPATEWIPTVIFIEGIDFAESEQMVLMYQYLCTNANISGIYINVINPCEAVKKMCGMRISVEATNAAETSFLMRVSNRNQNSFEHRFEV